MKVRKYTARSFGDIWFDDEDDWWLIECIQGG